MHDLWIALSGSVHDHAKVLGVSGDTLTFVGGIFLAVDALFKKKEQLQLAAIRAIASDFTDAQDPDGTRLDPKEREDEALDKAVRFARIGACALAIGFLFLLLVRLCGE